MTLNPPDLRMVVLETGSYAIVEDLHGKTIALMVGIQTRREALDALDIFRHSLTDVSLKEK